MEGRSQPLNIKDAQTFQLALSLYEKKEYEKSLAEVEQIIKRRKEQIHGESLCLKALLLYHLKKDGDDVNRLMDEGTRVDAKSHVAWHMSGIYHKLRKEYAQAYKAYVTSYGLNRDNANVHQDLAMLAAQQRDFPVLVDVRRHILGTRMSARMAWTALAAALYLNKDYSGVEQTVSLYDEIMKIERSNKESAKNTSSTSNKANKKDKKEKKDSKKDKKDSKSNKNDASKDDKTASEAAPGKSVQEILADDVETSEMMMLRSKALVDKGDFARAVADLDQNAARVLDKLAWNETYARALVHTDKVKARTAYFQLLERNSENKDYYEALETLVDDKLQLYKDLKQRFPRSDMAHGRPLFVFAPAELPSYLDDLTAFLKTKLERNVPSTFKLVQTLYEDADKRAALTTVVTERLALPAKTELSIGETIFLARHYAFTGELSRGIELLEATISRHELSAAKEGETANTEDANTGTAEHTTTSLDTDTEIDLQLALAELLQRAGAFTRAAEIVSRMSDKLPGDRALNTAAARAMFRANDLEHAYALAYKFPIWGKYAENHEEAHKHVVAMESATLILLMAEAHFRRREHGMALKRADQVIKIFQTYFDEQYDFHFYGPKRGTLRAYADMVAWEDMLFRHPVYVAALKIAIAEWVSVARHEQDGLTEKELQAAKRHRAAQLDKLDLEADNDPFGLSLLESKSALQTAYDAWKLLDASGPHDLADSWWLAFQILLAQKKYVLANQALKKAKEFGLSASKVAAGGLMARYTLENDGAAPQVLRSVQLKMLPLVVTEGDVVNADPVDYANTYVTDLLDWMRVRRFIDSTDGIESQVIERLRKYTLTAFEAEQAFLIMQQVPGDHSKLIEAIEGQWPLQSFIPK